MASQYRLISGVDDSGVPQLVKVDAEGRLLAVGVASGGLALPPYDDSVLANYGGTNNLHTVTLKLAGVTLGAVTLSYAGGGAANNDTLTRVQWIPV